MRSRKLIGCRTAIACWPYLMAVCWGVNFPATTFALQHFPPLLMVALRFTLIAIPTMIFVPWPRCRRAG